MQNANEFSLSAPKIGFNTHVSPHALLWGNVTLGEQCSVWPYAVLRGDVAPIRIEHRTNIQEHVTLHVSRHASIHIGSNVTIGHGAVVHGCTVENFVIIGMHATILDGAHIGHHCIIGANALVTENETFPPYSLILGIPGKRTRTLTEADLRLIEESAQVYLDSLAHLPF